MAKTNPDHVWQGLSPEHKEAVLMAASLFQRLGTTAQQIGATGGLKATRSLAWTPEVHEALKAMWPIAPVLQGAGYDVAAAAAE